MPDPTFWARRVEVLGADLGRLLNDEETFDYCFWATVRLTEGGHVLDVLTMVRTMTRIATALLLLRDAGDTHASYNE